MQRRRSGEVDQGAIITIMVARVEAVNMVGATLAEEAGGGKSSWWRLQIRMYGL